MFDNARLIYTVKPTIFEINIGHRRAGITIEQEGVIAFLAGDIADIYIPDDRRMFPDIAFRVIKINPDDGFADLADGHVAHVDIFDDTTPQGIGFNAQKLVPDLDCPSRNFPQIRCDSYRTFHYRSRRRRVRPSYGSPE